MRYDVIVVGARCAGATLATLQARSGAKVLMLDAQAAGSDMPLSTHYIQWPGMQVLDEIGVGDAIRACTPPNRRLRAQVDEHAVYVERPAARLQYCPRRSVLDPLLQKTAQEAGAELRERTRVVGLEQRNGRVTGVVAECGSRRETIHADLVVGADGRNSAVARSIGAESYYVLPGTRSAYWFYFPAPAIWHEDERYRDWDALIGWQGDGMRYLFQCDNNLLLMAAAPPEGEFRSWNGDYRRRTLDYLRACEITRPLVDASKPLGKGVGMASLNFYYRRAAGPGWALVGDAGNFKDPVTGHGMADAFVGARKLHAAILQGGDAALERYWRERDAATLAWHFDAYRLGEVGVNTAFLRMLFENLARRPDLAQRMAAIQDRELSPLTAFSPGELLGMVGSAVLRGRFGVIPPFLNTAKRMASFRKAVTYRHELLQTLVGHEVMAHAADSSAIPAPGAA